MANCPKCNQHLRLRDWKQMCPYCGANIVMYNLQERLMQDADKAEVEYYYHRKKVDRVKASFIGSPFAIARIFTSLLPVGALFLPLMNNVFLKSFEDIPSELTIINIYNLVSNGDFLSVLKNDEAGTGGTLFFAALVLLLLSVLLLLIHFVFLTLSCSPRGKARNYTFSILMLLFAAAYVVLTLLIPANEFVGASVGYGSYLYILLLAVNLIIEVLTFRKGIEVKHAQCYVGGIPIEEYFEMQKN
ncbi:MAG: hypothetical protein IJU45_07030 [Clostridia bacterium]|nr:hypothetical protein [Clostridia bacterium]